MPDTTPPVVAETRTPVIVDGDRKVPDLPRVYVQTPEVKRKRYWLLVQFLIVVVLPTVATCGYYGLIASDIYETETKFWIRGQETGAAGGSSSTLAALSGARASREEARTVADYFLSHDAVRSLQNLVDLRSIYERPEADFLSRLSSDASSEDLLSYYQGMVTVNPDVQSGMVTLSARAFRPADTVAIAEALLLQGELVINDLNDRANEDLLALARSELARAEARLLANREELAEFRQSYDQINPESSSEAALGLIATLKQQVAATEAEIAEMQSFMRPDSLQIQGKRQRIDALLRQIEKEQQALTGNDAEMANILAEYDRLLLERDLANRVYESALASLESARVDAVRQQHYLVRVVSPDLPDEAEYPRRLRNSMIVFVGSLLVLGIGRLIYAGIKDHVMT